LTKIGQEIRPLEHDAIDAVGDIIRWEQQLRFRHLATRQYLCITTDRRVTLTADSKDPRTVFRLHPVIKVCAIVTLLHVIVDVDVFRVHMKPIAHQSTDTGSFDSQISNDR